MPDGQDELENTFVDRSGVVGAATTFGSVGREVEPQRFIELVHEHCSRRAGGCGL